MRFLLTVVYHLKLSHPPPLVLFLHTPSQAPLALFFLCPPLSFSFYSIVLPKKKKKKKKIMKRERRGTKSSLSIPVLYLYLYIYSRPTFFPAPQPWNKTQHLILPLHCIFFSFLRRKRASNNNTPIPLKERRRRRRKKPSKDFVNIDIPIQTPCLSPCFFLGVFYIYYIVAFEICLLVLFYYMYIFF